MAVLLAEALADGHTWWRIADPAWEDPLDPSYAARVGGRWNPPDSFPTLYLSEDLVTARANLRKFIADWAYEPEDLRPGRAPLLVGARLPRAQRAADLHTPRGLARAGLPRTYPRDASGAPVPHAACQSVGVRASEAGLRGVRARSAQTADGVGRELAWFPATARSRAREVARSAFADWYWA